MHPPREIKAAGAENRAKRQQNDRPEDRTVILMNPKQYGWVPFAL